jgi:hypothetical protein
MAHVGQQCHRKNKKYIYTDCKKIYGINRVKFFFGFLWYFLYILRIVTSNELRTDAVFLPFFGHKTVCIYKRHLPQMWSVLHGSHFFMNCGLSVSCSTSLNCDTVSDITVTFPPFPCPTFNQVIIFYFEFYGVFHFESLGYAATRWSKNWHSWYWYSSR